MFSRNTLSVLLLSCTVFITPLTLAKSTRLTDDQVKQQIIDESIASYSGSCACPYNSARNGSHCGKRSAWSRAGGAAPLCYKNEISKQQVTQWREANT